MVKLYLTTIEHLPDPQEELEMMSAFSVERREKTLRYMNVEDRKQSLAAGLLLQHILRLYGKDWNDIHYSMEGKPQVDGICFNLSHSHEVIACAVSDKEVGCDVERIRAKREGIAERFFHTEEVVYLNQFDKKERDREFIRLWTMKESYIKMTGEGMKLSFDQFQVLIDQKANDEKTQQHKMQSIKIIRAGEVCQCHVKEYMIPAYWVSVCAEEDEFAEEIEYVTFAC